MNLWIHSTYYKGVEQMKAVYRITATVVILAIGFAVYTWYDLKKFEKEHSQVIEVGSEKEKLVDTNSGEPVKTGGKQDTAEKTGLGQKTNFHHDVEEKAPESPEISKHENDKNHSHAHTDADKSQTVSKVHKSAVKFFDRTTDQQIAKLREWLVDNHDNPAEIEEYLQLRRQSIDNRVTFSNGYSVLNMHIDDQIRQAELQVKLYPNLGNEGGLLQLLETKARIESGKLIPIYELPREMWEQISSNIDPID
jgi:hypothetical protein